MDRRARSLQQSGGTCRASAGSADGCDLGMGAMRRAGSRRGRGNAILQSVVTGGYKLYTKCACLGRLN
jgi:hypothetical protein